MLQRLGDFASQELRTALLVTVGGSSSPIVYAMERHLPDYVVFVCSSDQKAPVTQGSHHQVEGPGQKVCSAAPGHPPTLPNIRVQAGMEHLPYDIVLVDRVDDLPLCYRACFEAMNEIARAFPHAQLVADYTGGTKTMSAGLAAAAIDHGACKLSVVSGDRNNLIKVEEGTQFLRPTDARAIQTRRQLSRAADLMRAYDYPALEALVVALSREQHAPQDEDEVRILTTLSRAFEAWDRFDHLHAYKLLAPYRGTMRAHVMFLEAVCSARRAMDPDFDPGEARRDRGQGVELIEDLVLHAERRAHRKRFDDALGRLYRATEMLVQYHLLRTYGLQTHDLDRDKLPHGALETLFPHDLGGPLRAGLMQSYELLGYFPGDKLWPVYSKYRSKLLDALTMRNRSLFAHGFRPMTRSDYLRAREIMGGLISEAIEVLASTRRYQAPVQFPQDLLAPFAAELTRVR